MLVLASCVAVFAGSPRRKERWLGCGGLKPEDDKDKKARSPCSPKKGLRIKARIPDLNHWFLPSCRFSVTSNNAIGKKNHDPQWRCGIDVHDARSQELWRLSSQSKCNR
jgi:hypothetical protein